MEIFRLQMESGAEPHQVKKATYVGGSHRGQFPEIIRTPHRCSFIIDIQSSLYSAFAGMVLIKICMLRQSSRPKGPIRVAVFDAHCERNQIGPFQKPSQQDDGVYIYIHNIYT